jgi:two-component system alkaline phosphatase synthesis response regulator PhoP
MNALAQTGSLDEPTLRNLLSREDLTQFDKALCCLAFERDSPKLVKAIKALATRNGLDEIKGWNLSAMLSEESRYAFRTREGWELTIDGLAYVEAIRSSLAKALAAPRTLAKTTSEGLSRPHKILIAGSDPHTMQLLDFIFLRAGYQVFTALDGRQAQAFLENELPVDLIVTALTMPYVTGYQLIVDAKQDSAWMHVPIIVLSGKVLEMDVVRALDLGANDYVTKPFRPGELLARARRLIITFEGLGNSG